MGDAVRCGSGRNSGGRDIVPYVPASGHCTGYGPETGKQAYSGSSSQAHDCYGTMCWRQCIFISLYPSGGNDFGLVRCEDQRIFISVRSQNI